MTSRSVGSQASRIFCICLSGWVLSATSSLAANAPSTPAPVPPAAAGPRTESQQEAAKLLKSMAEYLAGLKSFSCTSSNGYETVQPNGQKIEFGESRKVSLARPDRLRIEEVASDGVKDLALFDGMKITVYSADDKVYAQATQPPSIEDALVYFVRDLRMRAPLALLLSTHVRTELPAMAKELDYVEKSSVRGQPAHHLAGRSDSVDFQVWVAEGAKPVPLRIVITYKQAPGQPRFWADLHDWNTAPKFPTSTFQLALPKEAKQIPFAVQLSALGAMPPGQAAPGPAASGEVKP
jgi:hypothetical protein